ncbi:uncharacterized protein PHACADRAFT_247580 [Phanerochaete carnosa HHB-10118-sp]|uniref:Uncharacterized protein n=1 Tax=Phanerochaete carnosa (strain HHB-10118-sp) TaxID=650164 RepID=K5XDP6_PHACS|nr:uncharacterized protein PHACADRAFT_247580 [Phanerochaete carnosa HHB-10118-sp]EKM61157.1 hypothetical protein PHACADRAFT_247580 [Phanerochaete carnosa HHB-10118-sp]
MNVPTRRHERNSAGCAQRPAAFAGPSSPVRSDRSMTPADNVRPVPTMPLNVHKRSSSPANRRQVPSHLDESLASPFQRNSATTSKPSYLSSHDWHDGSSSIANDPYGEEVLSTSLITSLLSSVPTINDKSSSTAGPPSFKRNNYEPSVVSNALTVDSTITYPPPKTFPPPLPSTDYKYPPLPTAFSVRPSPENTIDISSPQALNPPVHNLLPIADRSAPGPWVSEESVQVSQPGDAVRAICVTPSVQSMTSSTPLMSSFAKGDPILEEEPQTGGPSTASQSRHSRTRSRRTSTANSAKTSKSFVSSLIGRISHSSGDRSLKQTTMAWFRGKPLPPVPPIPDHAFREIQKAEGELPLPKLINRAQALSSLLDRGHRPYHSAISLDNAKERTMSEQEELRDIRYSGADPAGIGSAGGRSRDRSPRPRDWPPEAQDPSPPTASKWFMLTRRRKLMIGAMVILLVICVTVGVAVGVTVGEKHAKHTCPGNMAGAACTLNATCVCSTGTKGQCTGNSLAQVLVDLIPDVNRLFNVNFTSTSVSTAFWQVQGAPTGSNCAEQANVIDVTAALDASNFPNRTQWAELALLWNFVLSQNVSATGELQQFVLQADWNSLGSSDGPISDSTLQFAISASGFQFDFASQTVVAPLAKFSDVGEPTAQQLGQLNTVAEAALDWMTTSALASSTQQGKALEIYWTNVLNQDEVDLQRFLSIVKGSPIMLPFDATAAPGRHNVSTLLTNSTSVPFPPPLSCYPGLNASQVQLIQQLETQVFGLTQASTASTFDPSCYPNRPIYGVLDIFQQRLPFADQRTGVAKQAALLTRDASVRAVMYSGELVSAFPGSGMPGPLSTNPLQYGTMSSFGHVILQYLSSIPDINVAKELVEFVLQSPALPPDSGAQSVLFGALSSLPIIEVAIFGTVDPSDIASAVSSLSDPTQQLFFGTDASAAMRDWSINAVGHGLLWTELATSQYVVVDNSFANADFNFVYSNASAFFHLSDPNAIVNVGNITSAFSSFRLLQETYLITS